MNSTEYFYGPNFTDPSAEDTVIIVGTVGHSKVIDDLISSGKLDVSGIRGKWESFVSKLVEGPVPGCPRAVVVAGSDPRGAIFGIYDLSEQLGVSPWHWWADVPVQRHAQVWFLPAGKVQGPPSVKYRGFFLNDEQPGLSGWVGRNYADTPDGAVGYGRDFYPRVFEVLLRLRANYLWPALWGSMFEVDDPANQPLADAWEVVLGSSHTEPMMRAQNEFQTFYSNEGLGPWAYNLNNKTIDEYFAYGARRAKPYARNSLWTMGMRGTGDTAIEGLGTDVIVAMLETLVEHQRRILEDVLAANATDVPQMWCLYKEVMSYLQDGGLEVPEDITLLWADDNWGNVRRVPVAGEKRRPGGAGVYYHFDYVGDVRSYKWVNTVQLEKTAEQMQLAYAHGADRIWVVNVGDLKPLELPLSHFLDMAYDAGRWGVGAVGDWLAAWAAREFGAEHADDVAGILTRFGMYAARRKFELVEPHVYSVVNYGEADAVLAQWARLAADAQRVYEGLGAPHRAAYFEMVLHPVLGGELVHKVHIGAAKNAVYAGQRRNSANDYMRGVMADLDADGELTRRWDGLLDGKWAAMMDRKFRASDQYGKEGRLTVWQKRTWGLMGTGSSRCAMSPRRCSTSSRQSRPWRAASASRWKARTPRSPATTSTTPTRATPWPCRPWTPTAPRPAGSTSSPAGPRPATGPPRSTRRGSSCRPRAAPSGPTTARTRACSCRWTGPQRRSSSTTPWPRSTSRRAAGGPGSPSGTASRSCRSPSGCAASPPTSPRASSSRTGTSPSRGPTTSASTAPHHHCPSARGTAVWTRARSRT